MPTRSHAPRIHGRQIDLLFTGLAVSMLTFGWFQLFDKSGVLADYQPANYPAIGAALAGVIIVVAWLFRRRDWMLFGLQLACWVMVFRLAFIVFTSGVYSINTGLTLGWTLMVIGTWLREVWPLARAKSVEIAAKVGA